MFTATCLITIDLHIKHIDGEDRLIELKSRFECYTRIATLRPEKKTGEWYNLDCTKVNRRGYYYTIKWTPYITKHDSDSGRNRELPRRSNSLSHGTKLKHSKINSRYIKRTNKPNHHRSSIVAVTTNRHPPAAKMESNNQSSSWEHLAQHAR